MARAPLLQLSDISLTFGGDPVFSGLSLNVQPGDRVALVGRNGSGKSTLMKVMAGLVEPDSGDRVAGPGITVGYMEQDPTMEGFATLGDFASSRLDAAEMYKIEMVAEGLKFDPARPVATASGGERRRAALARLMAQEPALMLLDEPTNHLDIDAREALVQALNKYEGAIVIVSHDPNMVERVADRLWVVRDGRCEHFDGDLEDYRNFTIQTRRDQRKESKKKKEKAPAEKKQAANPQAIAKLEKKIEKLETQKTELETIMSAEGFYTKPHDETTPVQDKHVKVTEELEAVEAQWLEAQAG